MIQKFVAWALANKFIVLASFVLLAVGCSIAFRMLPIEAFPDVIDTHVPAIG